MNQKIILTSKSELKGQVVLEAIKKVFPDTTFDLIQFDLEMNGPEPVGEKALISEITDHLKKARISDSTAAFYIAMEGGVQEGEDGTNEVAMVIVENNEGVRSISRAASFPVPPKIANKVKNGIPFADAVNEEYSTKDIKNTQGFVGLLTNGVVDKKALYLQPAIIAFSRYSKMEWFGSVSDNNHLSR